jgi:hypothetical protein
MFNPQEAIRSPQEWLASTRNSEARVSRAKHARPYLGIITPERKSIAEAGVK